MPTNNYNEIKPKKVGHLKGRKCEQRPPERKSTRQKWGRPAIIPAFLKVGNVYKGSSGTRGCKVDWGHVHILQGQGRTWSWSSFLTQNVAAN